MAKPKITAGTVIAGRYRLVAPLSRGGMGSVWRAEHLSLGSPIAIKLIDATLVEHDEPRARFEQEARAAAALRSPHVVQILDHGVDRGLPFIAMELLDGESLGARLHRLGALPPAQVVRIFQDVARAMKKAHEIGIIHRDLKPDNIFLVRNDDQEIAKVLDFGIAKATEPLGDFKGGGTRTGALIGTPQYMSPEQAQGMTLDHASDLWSLGVIAFECLCGRHPFPSEKPGELILQICAKPIPIPSTVARGAPLGAAGPTLHVPPRFDAWFARACDREPSARFASAKELADTLADALGLAGSPADRSGGFAPIPGPTAIGVGPVQAMSPVVAAAPPPAAAPAPMVPVAHSPLGAPVSPGGPSPVAHDAGPLGPGGALRTPSGTELRPPMAAPLSPPAGAAVSPPQGPVFGAAVSPPQGPVFGAPVSPPGAPAPPVSSPVAAAATLMAGTSPLDERAGTMNGGAVVDSDPSTLLLVPSARSKKTVIAAVAGALAVLCAALVWVVARGPDGPAAGADSAFPPSPTAPLTAPLPTVAPASPGSSQTANPAETASAAPSSSGGASPRPGASASAKSTAGARPWNGQSAAPRPTASSTNTRIGF